MALPNRAEDLQRQVLDYAPADPAEAEHRRRILDLLSAPGDPFTRSRFAPGHITASAFVLSPDEDALLLLRHPKLGRWLQPGGHVEPDDADLEAAARREVREETGFDLPPGAGHLFDLDIHPIPARRDEPAHEHFDVRLLVRAPSRELPPNDEGTELRWVHVEDLAASAEDASVRRAAQKLLS